jgi:hypothetical protein
VAGLNAGAKALAPVAASAKVAAIESFIVEICENVDIN